MLGPFRNFTVGRGEPSLGGAVLAKGYARHHLGNACIFWGAAAVLSGLAIAALVSARLGEGPGLADLPIAAAGLGLVVSLAKGGRALRDLLDEPVSFEGKVAEKAASLLWNRLAFLEDKYYLHLERPPDFRPLTHGTGHDVEPGWFLAAQGYHDLLAAGDRVRGTVYRRTRLIASLVKL